MDKIKVYQDVLNEGHYKLLSDNLETIKEDDLLLFEEDDIFFLANDFPLLPPVVFFTMIDYIN